MVFYRMVSVFFMIVASNLSFSQKEIDFAPKMLFRNLNAKEIDLEEMQGVEFGQNLVQNGKYFKIMDEVSETKFVYIGRVNSCRSGGCSVDGGEVIGGFEYFDYFILFDRNATIQQIKIFNYQATKGQEVTAKNWLKQFIGYKGDHELIVGKQIDSISGATVSAYSLTEDVQLRTEILRKMYRKD